MKRHHESFSRAVSKGRNEKLKLPVKVPKKMTPPQRKVLKEMEALRLKAAEKVELPAHLIMNKDQMIDIAVNNNYKSLRTWQKKQLDLL